MILWPFNSDRHDLVPFHIDFEVLDGSWLCLVKGVSSKDFHIPHFRLPDTESPPPVLLPEFELLTLHVLEFLLKVQKRPPGIDAEK